MNDNNKKLILVSEKNKGFFIIEQDELIEKCHDGKKHFHYMNKQTRQILAIKIIKRGNQVELSRILKKILGPDRIKFLTLLEKDENKSSEDDTNTLSTKQNTDTVASSKGNSVECNEKEIIMKKNTDDVVSSEDKSVKMYKNSKNSEEKNSDYLNKSAYVDKNTPIIKNNTNNVAFNEAESAKVPKKMIITKENTDDAAYNKEKLVEVYKNTIIAMKKNNIAADSKDTPAEITEHTIFERKDTDDAAKSDDKSAELNKSTKKTKKNISYAADNKGTSTEITKHTIIEKRDTDYKIKNNLINSTLLPKVICVKLVDEDLRRFKKSGFTSSQSSKRKEMKTIAPVRENNVKNNRKSFFTSLNLTPITSPEKDNAMQDDNLSDSIKKNYSINDSSLWGSEEQIINSPITSPEKDNAMQDDNLSDSIKKNYSINDSSLWGSIEQIINSPITSPEKDNAMQDDNLSDSIKKNYSINDSSLWGPIEQIINSPVYERTDNSSFELSSTASTTKNLNNKKLDEKELENRVVVNDSLLDITNITQDNNDMEKVLGKDIHILPLSSTPNTTYTNETELQNTLSIFNTTDGELDFEKITNILNSTVIKKRSIMEKTSDPPTNIDSINDDGACAQMYQSFDPDDDSTFNREMVEKLFHLSEDQLVHLSNCEKSYGEQGEEIITLDVVNSTAVDEQDNTIEETDDANYDPETESVNQSNYTIEIIPDINNATINVSDHDIQGRDSLIDRAVGGNEITDPQMSIVYSDAGTKKYSCIFCKKKVAKIARHFMSVHKNELRIQKIAAYKPNDPMRKAMLNFLRNEGSFEFNRLSDEKNRPREVSRRPNPMQKITASDYVYCPNCLASFRKSTFVVHLKKCTGKPINGRKTPQQAAKKLADDCHHKISKNLRHILSVLDTDEVGRHAKLDELIILYGNLLAVQYKPERNYDMVRQRLRILARLVLAAKIKNHDIYDLKSLIHPNNFDACLAAVDQVAGLSEDGESFKSPATAAAIGTLLNDVSNLLICETLKVGDKVRKENVRDFQRLLKRSWKAHVSKKVHETQQQNRRKKKIELPILDDVICLMTFLKNKQTSALGELETEFSSFAWEELTKSTLLIIQIFNRRRAGETERITVEDFQTCETINNETHSDILKKLGKNEQKTCEKYKLMKIRGKLVRCVPVLLDNDMYTAILTIIKNRNLAGVDPKNPYVFGMPGAIQYKAMYFRACALMREYSVACGASKPHTLRGTELRKHLATNLESFNSKNIKRSVVADHLGHDIRIHKEFYQLQDIAKEIVTMSGVLETACGNNNNSSISNNGDHSTDEENSDNEPSNRRSLVEDNSPYMELQTAGTSRYNDYLETVDSGNDDTDTPWVPPVKKQKTTAECGAIKRPAWTTAEKEAMKKHFASYIENKKYPGFPEIERVLKIEPILRDRKRETLKTWFSNYWKSKEYLNKVSKK